MTTLRDFQIALQMKLEELRQKDELLEELQKEILSKDDQIKSLKTELGKYRSLVLNTASLQHPTHTHSPLIYSNPSFESLSDKYHTPLGPNRSVPSRRPAFTVSGYNKAFEMANQQPQHAYIVNNGASASNSQNGGNAIREKLPAISAEPTNCTQSLTMKPNHVPKNQK